MLFNYHHYMITGCDRNLVNCVNNIAQINTDCAPHPQLSPEGKKHENHQMSKFCTACTSNALHGLLSSIYLQQSNQKLNFLPIRPIVYGQSTIIRCASISCVSDRSNAECQDNLKIHQKKLCQ